MPGPPPKRDAERRRVNQKAIPTTTVDVADLISRPIEVPVPNEEWHPIAVMAFESLTLSGQAMFYEPSDWAVAFLLAEEISRELQPKPFVVTDKETGEQYVEWHEAPMPGSKITAILKGFTSLMATEADRRRLSLEIERKRGDLNPDAVPEGATSIFKNRRAALEA